MSRILVVDDVPANVQILGIHLSDEGYQVVEAQGGQQALDILLDESEQIDLVLLDVMMPVMNGLQVLEQLKKNPNTQHLPVILVTANADDQNVADGLDLGAFDYIIKPYSLMVLLARVRAALREKERQDLLEKWATTDPLTGLYNRRHFFELAQRELDRAQRSESALSFIILDIDHFKQVNDQYGHDAGDTVLVETAQLLQNLLRKVDFCCRYGGEEFVLCLPDTPADGTFELAERIREKVAKLPISTSEGQVNITISLGLATRQQESKVDAILKRADQALYQAKENGRNQSCKSP